jgi:hypothetical protein
MKYVVVAANASRGRNNILFKRLELARIPEVEGAEPPTQRDAVVSITVTDRESPLWAKEVDGYVEVA